MPKLLPPSSLPPHIRQIIVTFGITSWIGFWGQVVLGGVSALTLLLAIPGRNLGESTKVAGTGLSIFLAMVGLLWLVASLYLGFRYTRVAKRLRVAEAHLRPSKEETVKILRVGLLIDLIGAFVGLIGVEVSVGVLLAKALAQPQGVGIYDPLRIIRPLDVMVAMSNVNVLASFLVGLAVSLWLLHRLHRD